MTEAIDMSMADILREYRNRRDLTLRGLSAITGINSGNLSKYEQGTHSPNLATLTKLAAALGTEASALVAQAEGRKAA